MESRMEKYYKEDNSSMKRSSKNARLYQEVYRDYNDLDNLPIPDNTNEIDIPELQKMVKMSREATLSNTREYKNLTKEIEAATKKEKKEPEHKIHDINKLLEYAKNENNKLKEHHSNHENTANYKLLKTLENKTITKEEISHSNNNHTDDNLSQTNELKYQTKKISINPSIDQIITDDNDVSLSLDILSDLKSTGNTGTIKPISEEIDIHDIQNENNELDIIKEDVEEPYDDEDKDGSFYTDAFEFSNKDFESDDDDDFFDEQPKKHLGLKIFLLLLFIALCAAAIFYFISNYGLNN